ncbi:MULTISPECIES: hypothetical protein [Coprobacter]|nr:hypothetical protein [Coprobacter fastidiosus]
MAGKDNGGGGASYFPDRPGNATHILLSARRAAKNVVYLPFLF